MIQSMAARPLASARRRAGLWPRRELFTSAPVLCRAAVNALKENGAMCGTPERGRSCRPGGAATGNRRRARRRKRVHPNPPATATCSGLRQYCRFAAAAEPSAPRAGVTLCWGVIPRGAHPGEARARAPLVGTLSTTTNGVPRRFSGQPCVRLAKAQRRLPSQSLAILLMAGPGSPEHGSDQRCFCDVHWT
jgi:hypothetical protein